MTHHTRADAKHALLRYQAEQRRLERQRVLVAFSALMACAALLVWWLA